MIEQMKQHLEKKYDIKLDQQEIERKEKLSRNRDAARVYTALMHIKESGTFQEGDILVRKDSVYNYETEQETWVAEKFSDSNNANRKYKVVHVDEAGLAYVMKVSMKGDLCGYMTCIAGFDTSYTKFSYDEDFLDHQILAEENENFDPQAVYKEKRDEYFKTRPKRTNTKTK